MVGSAAHNQDAIDQVPGKSTRCKDVRNSLKFRQGHYTLRSRGGITCAFPGITAKPSCAVDPAWRGKLKSAVSDAADRDTLGPAAKQR